MCQPYYVTTICHWLISQTANKADGSCSVCLAVHQLHPRDGTTQLHGSRDKRCPGSHKPSLLDTSHTSQVSAKSAHGPVQVIPVNSNTDTNSFTEKPLLIPNLIIHHTIYVPSHTFQRASSSHVHALMCTPSCVRPHVHALMYRPT